MGSVSAAQPAALARGLARVLRAPHRPADFIHLSSPSTEGSGKELLAERVAFKVEEGERGNKKRVQFSQSIPDVQREAARPRDISP